MAVAALLTCLRVAASMVEAVSAAAMADFISKYNALVKDYKVASTSTKNADGSINQAPLASDIATRTMMVNYLLPLGGVLLGVTFLGEKLSWQLLAGLVLIISGLVVANWRTKQEASPGGAAISS